MKLIRVFIVLIMLPMITGASLHKFYVTTTKIEYNSEKKSLQIISKIFIDDIEDVLQLRYDPEISLSTKKERKKDEAYLKKYVLEKMVIHLDGTEKRVNYIGREYENDMVKIYLEVIPVDDFSEIEVENKILFDLTNEQQNIVHIKHHDVRRSLVLTPENPNGMLNFD